MSLVVGTAFAHSMTPRDVDPSVSTLSAINEHLGNSDSESPLRIGACASPTNSVPGAPHISTYAHDSSSGRFIHHFASTANDGKTRTSW